MKKFAWYLFFVLFVVFPYTCTIVSAIKWATTDNKAEWYEVCHISEEGSDVHCYDECKQREGQICKFPGEVAK